MHTSSSLGLVASLSVLCAAASGCEAGSSRDGGLFGTASGVTGAGTGGSSGDGSADSGVDSGSDSDPQTSGITGAGSSGDTSGDGGDGGIKLDVGAEPTTGAFPECDPMVEDCGCTAVDLLFVVDNSVSMGDYQNALSLAFPNFANAIFDALPPGTSLHVGVTSTTMGMSSSGSTTNCTATGDDGKPQDFFYQTPDAGSNGVNGAQGRLYNPGGGVYYYETSTDGGAAAVTGLAEWFSKAAKIGESGSQIEMSAAAAGWAADPANDATNAGFIRDEGAVLVLFFLQDEPDQTPWTIDGSPGGLAMLDKITAAKAGCGGANCVIGGGFVNTGCLGQVPLGDLLNNLGADPVVAALPDDDLAEDNPQQAANEMNDLLEVTLAGVIAQKCDEIQPEG